MRAAVIAGSRRLEIIDAAPPIPAPRDVRVRLEGCGVCASNLPVWEGRPWFSYPLDSGAPGHEGWGRIDALGPGTRGLAPGDRVACISYRAHAELEYVGGQWALADDGLSRNGTFVNGQPVRGRRRLRDGDCLRLGQTVLAFAAPLLPGADATLPASALGPAIEELTATQRRILADKRTLQKTCRNNGVV